MVKNFEDLQQVSKDNVDVTLKAMGALSKGTQAIAVEVADYSKKAFEKVNAAREAEGEPLFANPRNAAAGTMRLLDSRETARRRLDAWLYGIVEAAELPADQSATLTALKALGFPVNPHWRRCETFAEVGAFA